MKNSKNLPTARDISKLTGALIWLNAAFWGIAGLIRLAGWLKFSPSGSKLPLGFVIVSSISILTCIAAVSGGIILIRRSRLAAYVLTGAYLGGIASYLAVWMKLPSVPLPYKPWILGAVSIFYIWTLQIRGILR